MNKTKRYLIKRIVSCILAFVMLFEMCPISTYADEQNGMATVDANGMNYAKWLSYMPSDMPISRINMPASHDAGCYAPLSGWDLMLINPLLYAAAKFFGEGMAKTQTKSITEQLNSGFRVFDIRGGYELLDPEDLMVNHKLPMKYNKNKSRVIGNLFRFSDVFNDIEKFLKDNPSETVVLTLTSEGFFGEDKTQELISKFCDKISSPGKDSNYRSKFIYFPPGSEVPTLGAVRGRCVVLPSYGDRRTYTKYEDHCEVSVQEKDAYIDHYFKSHNGTDKFSNKMGLHQLGKDRFERESKQNHLKDGDDVEEDPMVKLANYSACRAGGPWPRTVANTINPKYGKNSFFLSEVRYGWVGKDFIGEYDPTDGIIESNVGCTNYYATINLTDKERSEFNIGINNIVLMKTTDTGSEQVELKEDMLSVKRQGDKVYIVIKDLPLYTQNGSRFGYKMRLEGYKLFESKSQVIQDKYLVADGKWCGRRIFDEFTLEKNQTSVPVEIRWIYSDSTPFDEPQKVLEFYNICDELTLKMYTDSGIDKEVILSKYDDFRKVPHFKEFEAKKDPDGRNYYETEILGLTQVVTTTGEEYKYDFKKLLFDNSKDFRSYFWHSEVGDDGVLRLYIDVHSYLDRMDITGVTNWYDGYDMFGKRDEAYDSVFDHEITVYKKITGVASQYDTEEVKVSKSASTDTKSVYVANIRRYDDNGNPYEKYTFGVPNTIGDHYRKVGQGGTESDYALTAPTDLTVVWNVDDMSSIPTEYSNGMDIKLSGSTVTLNASPVSPDDTIWVSETTERVLFNGSRQREYQDRLASESITDIRNTLGSNYTVTASTVMDIEADGYPGRHFVVYIDEVRENTISGSITWNDGILDIAHDSIECIKLYREEVGSKEEVTDQLTWTDNRYFSINVDATEIGLYSVEAQDVEGYICECVGDDTNNYRYTKEISVNVEANPSEILAQSTCVLMQNDVAVDDPDMDGETSFINLPIADENNDIYDYWVDITAPSGYSVDIIDSVTDPYTGDITIYAEFYEDTNVEIPVEVELLGRDTSLDHTFIFNIDGYGDDGQLSVDPIELSKAEDYKGKFVIPADKFSNAENNYYLSVYQTIGNDANIEYDSNISTIKLGVMYLNGQKLFTYEWGEFDDGEWKPLEDVTVSKFTNKIKDIPARLRLDDLKHQSKVPEGSSYGVPAADFTYMLIMQDGEDAKSLISLSSVSAADGTSVPIVFGGDDDPIMFYDEGDYTLYVSCADTEQKGWYYDTKPYEITFSVRASEDNPNILLITDLAYDDELQGSDNTITQIYSEVSYQIPVGKKLIGIDNTTYEFTFEAKEVFEEEPVTTTITGAGEGKFPAITYYEPGIYRYLISENIIVGDVDWICDDSVVGYDVTVSRQEDGSLKVENDGDEVPTFVNRYMRKPIPVKVLWIDSKDSKGTKPFRPNSVNFTLSEDGALVGQGRSITGKNADSEWEYSTEAMQLYKLVDGQKVEKEYTIDVSAIEASIGNHYSVEWYGDGIGGFVIICAEKALEETFDLPIIVEWDDDNNRQNKRPSEVTVGITQEPQIEEYDQISMSSLNEWKNKWQDLPKYLLGIEDEKVEIEYSLNPTIVPDYELDISKKESGEYVLTYSLSSKKPPKKVEEHAKSEEPEEDTPAAIVVERIYPLHFETNGGTPIETFYAGEGTIVELNKFITLKDGAVFTGWHLDKELKQKADKLVLQKETTVYAGWNLVSVPLKDVNKKKTIDLSNGGAGKGGEGDYLVAQNDILVEAMEEFMNSKAADASRKQLTVIKEIPLAGEGTVASAGISEMSMSRNLVLALIGGIGILGVCCSLFILLKKKKR